MDLQVYDSTGSEKVLIQDANEVTEVAVFQNSRYISASVQSAEMLNLIPGDYITIDGENFHLINIPECTKRSSQFYIWKLVFYHDILFFDRSIMQTEDGLFNFDLTLDAEGFVDFVLSNVNYTIRTSPDYFSKGSVESSEPQNLRFEGTTGLKALQMICEAFGLQYKMESKILSLSSDIGAVTGYNFKVEPAGGLASIKRIPDSNDKVTTALFFEGSKKNLPAGYRSNQTHPLGYPRLRSADSPYLDNQRYQEIGGWERYQTYDELFPSFNGEVSTAPTKTTITCAAITFDLNSYLIPGKTAKIVFTSGSLNGRSFEIASFDFSGKQIIMAIGYDESGNELPSDTVKPAVGDKFVFVDIYLPQTYIDNAESRLHSKGVDLIQKYNNYPAGYAVEFDEQFLQKNNVKFKPGDKVTIIEPDFDLNGIMQVMSFTRSLEDPFRYSNIEIAILRRLSLNEKIMRSQLIIRGRTAAPVTKSVTAGTGGESQTVTLTLTKKQKTTFQFINPFPDLNYSLSPSSVMVNNQVIWFEYPEADRQTGQAAVISTQNVTVAITIIKHN